MRRVIDAELLKWQHTPFLWVTIAAALAAPFLVVLMLSGRGEPVSWDLYLGQVMIFYAILTGPLIVTLIGAQSIAVEYQCDTWKMVLATPTPRWQVYLAKCLVGLVWVLGLTALVGGVSCAVGSVLALTEALDPGRWSASYAVAGVGLFAMLPFYQLVTLIFRSFFVTSGVGIVGAFAGFIVLNSEYAGLYPISGVMVLAVQVSRHIMLDGIIGTPEIWAGLLIVVATASLALGLLRLQTVDVR